MDLSTTKMLENILRGRDRRLTGPLVQPVDTGDEGGHVPMHTSPTDLEHLQVPRGERLVQQVKMR